MTIIIGIKCKDGAVIGADSVATLGNYGRPTVEQHTNKIEVVDNRMIVATSGFVGLGQRITVELAQVWDGKLSKQDKQTARKSIRDGLVKHVGPEFEMAQKAVPIVGAQVAGTSAIISTVVACPIQKDAMLVIYDHQCASEEVTETLPFVSIGSGQGYADPFLAFLKRVLWNDKAPTTVGEGVLAALWTLNHVIQTAAGGGIGGDPKIAVLERKGEGWIARQLSDAELEEPREAITGAEMALRSYFNRASIPAEATP